MKKREEKICPIHNVPFEMYGGNYRCKPCKRESDQLNKDGRFLFWSDRLDKVGSLKPGYEFHHQKEKPVKGWIIKKLNIPKQKNGQFVGIRARLQDANYSFKQELLFRLELACCKPMLKEDHQDLHVKLREGKHGR